jgi:hypothetical protein
MKFLSVQNNLPKTFVQTITHNLHPEALLYVFPEET